eukprot:Opistho-1_new@26974
MLHRQSHDVHGPNNQRYRTSLVASFASQAAKGPENYLQIQPEAGLAHIAQIGLQSLIPYCIRSVQNLRQPRDAWSHPVPLLPLRNRIVPTLHRNIRPRADYTHFTFQHVQQLGQLIQAGATKESAHSGNTRIIDDRLIGAKGGSVFYHAAEFEHSKLAPIQPNTYLSKKNWLP